ncbi:hypothetical protein BH11ARM1_BH11ARM1_00150 [soil metagenome]
MRVLAYEDNLLWSSRLKISLTNLGHEALLRTRPSAEHAEVAIVNLGAESLTHQTLVPQLRELGVIVIGHAGHKEKDLHQLGREAGCDILATNSELTHKIESLLERAAQLRQ